MPTGGLSGRLAVSSALAGAGIFSLVKANSPSLHGKVPCVASPELPYGDWVLDHVHSRALAGSWKLLMRTHMLEPVEKCEAGGRRRWSAKCVEFAAPRQTQKGRFGGM